MDRLMHVAWKTGKAGREIKINYNSGKWNPDPKKILLDAAKKSGKGWLFYGFSMHAAYHSVMLAVDNTDPSNVKIYFMDQFSQGFSNDVTNENFIEKFEPSYGYYHSYLWQIIPSAKTLIDLR